MPACLLDLPDELLVQCWRDTRPQSLEATLSDSRSIARWMRPYLSSTTVCRRLQPIISAEYAYSMSFNITTDPWALIQCLKYNDVGRFIKVLDITAVPVDFMPDGAPMPYELYRRAYGGILRRLGKALPNLLVCDLHIVLATSNYLAVIEPEVEGLPIDSIELVAQGAPRPGRETAEADHVEVESTHLDRRVLSALFSHLPDLSRLDLCSVSLEPTTEPVEMEAHPNLLSLTILGPYDDPLWWQWSISTDLVRCFPHLESLTLSDCLEHSVLSILPETLVFLSFDCECEDVAAGAIALQCLARLPHLDTLELIMHTALDEEAWTQLLRACPPQLKVLVSDWAHDAPMCTAAHELLVDSNGARSQWLPQMAELVSTGRGSDKPEGPNEAWVRLDQAAEGHGIRVFLETLDEDREDLGGESEALGA
jgi:hypothetical protein